MKSRYLPRGIQILGLVVLVLLFSGCGGGSGFAANDTPEGEEFLKYAEEAWGEVKNFATAEYWQAKGEPLDPQKVQARIQEVQTETTKRSTELLKNKMMSKSQHERFLKILKSVR